MPSLQFQERSKELRALFNPPSNWGVWFKQLVALTDLVNSKMWIWYLISQESRSRAFLRWSTIYFLSSVLRQRVDRRNNERWLLLLVSKSSNTFCSSLVLNSTQVKIEQLTARLTGSLPSPVHSSSSVGCFTDEVFKRFAECGNSEPILFRNSWVTVFLPCGRRWIMLFLYFRGIEQILPW